MAATIAFSSAYMPNTPAMNASSQFGTRSSIRITSRAENTVVHSGIHVKTKEKRKAVRPPAGEPWRINRLVTSAGDVNTRTGRLEGKPYPRQSNHGHFNRYERPVLTMSTHCQNHNCQCALAGQAADDLKQTLSEMKKCMDSIDKHVTYWIGNTEPGYLPTEFREIKATVYQHETYIQQQKGAGKVGHYLWTALLALCAAVIGAFGKGLFK